MVDQIFTSWRMSEAGGWGPVGLPRVSSPLATLRRYLLCSSTIVIFSAALNDEVSLKATVQAAPQVVSCWSSYGNESIKSGWIRKKK